MREMALIQQPPRESLPPPPRAAALPIFMGTHWRLGAHSPLLSLDPTLLAEILDVYASVYAGLSGVRPSCDVGSFRCSCHQPSESSVGFGAPATHPVRLPSPKACLHSFSRSQVRASSATRSHRGGSTCKSKRPQSKAPAANLENAQSLRWTACARALSTILEGQRETRARPLLLRKEWCFSGRDVRGAGGCSTCSRRRAMRVRCTGLRQGVIPVLIDRVLVVRRTC